MICWPNLPVEAYSTVKVTSMKMFLGPCIQRKWSIQFWVLTAHLVSAPVCCDVGWQMTGREHTGQLAKGQTRLVTSGYPCWVQWHHLLASLIDLCSSTSIRHQEYILPFWCKRRCCLRMLQWKSSNNIQFRCYAFWQIDSAYWRLKLSWGSLIDARERAHTEECIKIKSLTTICISGLHAQAPARPRAHTHTHTHTHHTHTHTHTRTHDVCASQGYGASSLQCCQAIGLKTLIECSR